jgi:hypothetical protein
LCNHRDPLGVGNDRITGGEFPTFHTVERESCTIA